MTNDAGELLTVHSLGSLSESDPDFRNCDTIASPAVTASLGGIKNMRVADTKICRLPPNRF
jgi:hypothetical protein